MKSVLSHMKSVLSRADLICLSELLGQQVWRESGLGAPADVEQLRRRITSLVQQVVDLTGRLEERDQELDAARAANRELSPT